MPATLDAGNSERLTIARESLRAPAPRPFRRPRGSAEGLAARQRCKRNASPSRAIVNARSASRRARTPGARDADAAARKRGSLTAASCSRRCPIAACWRAALRWYATKRDCPIHAAASVGPGAYLTVEFADGRIGATADADRPAAARVERPVAERAEGISRAKRVVETGRSRKFVLDLSKMPMPGLDRASSRSCLSQQKRGSAPAKGNTRKRPQIITNRWVSRADSTAYL